MPIASAATSSSRTERKARPWVESRKRLATMMVPIATAQIQAKSARCGMGERPIAPPKKGVFSMITRMISPNPSVTIAR